MSYMKTTEQQISERSCSPTPRHSSSTGKKCSTERQINWRNSQSAGCERTCQPTDLNVGLTSLFSVASQSAYNDVKLHQRNAKRRRKESAVSHDYEGGNMNAYDNIPNKRRRNDSAVCVGSSHYGYKYLKELSCKQPHEIVAEVNKMRAPFDQLLREEQLKADWLLLILIVVRVVCKSDLEGNRCELLSKLCRAQLLAKISKYLAVIHAETSSSTRKNLPAFVDDLCVVYTSLLNAMPSVAVEQNLKATILTTKIAVESMRTCFGLHVDDVTTQTLDALCVRCDDVRAEIENRLPRAEKRTYVDRCGDRTPPEDYRELSLYPTYEDFAQSCLGFVRPSKTSGGYESVHHYLDVQFRLLREDFVHPLRKGLRSYTEYRSVGEAARCSKFRADGMHLYRETRFVSMTTTAKNHQLGLLVNFDPEGKLRNVRWERSKRFMHGSLLLFSADDFLTFFCATVLDRDPTALRSGHVLVSLTDDVTARKNYFDTTFLMAESKVFFEPYFLVMKTLRCINESNFPMAKYIVAGESAVEYPSYVRESGGRVRVDGQTVAPLTAPNSWPTANELGLDSFQYDALKAALTQDFCIIQGPPGTGKTFLGLKIIRNIWDNVKSNISDLKLPILVVCYTNHALDQFLEGVLQFTTNVVRVGGQSRSATMSRYNLRGQHYLGTVRRHCYSEKMASLRKQIKACRQCIDSVARLKEYAENPSGILRTSLLRAAVPAVYQQRVEKDENLREWLLTVDDSGDETWRFDDELRNFVRETCDTSAADGSNESTCVDDDDDNDNDNDNANVFVDDDDIYESGDCVDAVLFARHHSVTVKQLENQCRNLIENLNKIRLVDESAVKLHYELKTRLQRLMREYRTLKRNVRNARLNRRDDGASSSVDDGDVNVSSERRWTMYWSWVAALRQRLAGELEKYEQEHRTKMMQYEEFKQLEDLQIVQRADVVGMTTTGAARLRILLKSLKPAVVIVEEAAEVLEAHIVVSLTNHCQHLILIGDHQQLKPSAASIELRKYNIEVSLFERMINNGMNCPVLNVQHRMRPEISCLIVPLIYPNLQDHDSVTKLESVKGVTKNVFFVEHNIPEKYVGAEHDDTASKYNEYEARFVVMLARYLVQQGYNPETITILTTYSGQMFLVKDLKNEYLLTKYVKCVVVDKYQGEENDLIILSLVRSNVNGDIGFLKIQNRVCVALSRAKKGFFIIGNMSCLTKNCELWKKIEQTLKQKDAIGEKLPLHCDVHSKCTYVGSAEDFDGIQEGGCDLPCKTIMNCGHDCLRRCHALNRDHEDIRCREPCKNFCPRGHLCKQLCYEVCRKCVVPVNRTLVCGHTKSIACHIDEDDYLCDEIVDDVSPLCNHNVKRKCHQNAEEGICRVQCKIKLDCGHSCTRFCHKQDDPDHLTFNCRKPCGKRSKNCMRDHKCQKPCSDECSECIVKVKCELPCGHVSRLLCSVDVTTVKCFMKCEKICSDCGKRCSKRCWENCNPCLNQVEKDVPQCGHRLMFPCGSQPSQKNCHNPCKNKAPCGHRCRSKCYVQCGAEPCTELISLPEPKSPCGHRFVYIYCHERENFEAAASLAPINSDSQHDFTEDDDSCDSHKSGSSELSTYNPNFISSLSESSENDEVNDHYIKKKVNLNHSETNSDILATFSQDLTATIAPSLLLETTPNMASNTSSNNIPNEASDFHQQILIKDMPFKDDLLEKSKKSAFIFSEISSKETGEVIQDVIADPTHRRLPFKLKDITKSKVARTQNTKVRRQWDKRDLCLYCFQDITNFSRHLFRKHASEFSVKQIMALEKGSIERKKLIDVLRKQGNFLSPASHIIRPVKRLKREINPMHIIPCEYCKGYFLKEYLRHHIKNCSLRPIQCPKFKAARGQTMLATLSDNSSFTNQLRLRKEIFDTMNADEISLTAKMDPLICSFGEHYMKRHKHKHLNVVTKNKLRELARLVIESKKFVDIDNLYELMIPINFDTIVMSTKNVAGYNPQSRTYQNAPSLALHMGTLLTQVCEHIISLLLKEKEEFCLNVDVPKKIVEVKAMLELIKSNWNSEVSSIANQNLKENLAEKPTIIPLTSDIKLLNDYAKTNAQRYHKILQDNPKDKTAFVSLQESCFILILTLNRRRVGELERLPLKRYCENNETIMPHEFIENLEDTEKIMYQAFKRIQIRGKRHSTVPVLIPQLIQKYLDHLINIRSNFIPATNEFLFGAPNKENCINGSSVVIKFTEKCGAKYPKSLRSTKLRKHIASVSQIYHLNEEQVDQLCTFMGHTKTTHQEFYRLPNEIYQTAKLAKFLLKSQNEDVLNLDAELTSDEEDEDVDDPNEEFFDTPNCQQFNNTEELIHKSQVEGNLKDLAETGSTMQINHLKENEKSSKTEKKKKGKILRVRWTTEQKDLTIKHFKINIKNKKPPTEKEIENFRTQNKIMQNKDWKKIKAFVFNKYSKQ